MRVLTCHHFAYQEVFTTDYEPQTLFASDDKVFVATSQCYIEVHTLTEHGCPLITKFPTIGTVLQLKYSKSDNFIATLEEKDAKTSNGVRAVRVYLNWPTDGCNPPPMRARIAGYMTSLRHIEKIQDNEKRFEVVEIPLKEKPNCIAVDGCNGTLAIGVGHSVLLYGFCSKTVADSPWRYEDMKILLELRFSFVIEQVAVCEQFMSCSSDKQMQVVMLRTDGQEICPSKIMKPRLFESNNNGPKNSEKCTTGQSETLNGDATKEEKTKCPTAVEDDMPEKFKSSFNDRTFMPVGSRHKKSKQSKHAAEAKALKKKLEAELRKTGQIFGPILKPPECHVTIEYEDTCEMGDSLKYLHNSVSTYVYKKFETSEHRSLHSLQLIPIYERSEGTKEYTVEKTSESSKCSGTCCGEQRPLVGMYCFISTPIEGYLYKVFPCPELLVTVPYTAPSIQVCCTRGMFYVLTESGVEVYSSRCLAAALHQLNSYDGIHKTLLPPTMEVCLLGLHPFIGPQMAAYTSGFLVLFSKHISENDLTTEVNWSIYSLKTPKTLVLYNDMRELIEKYHRTAVPSSDITFLLKEAQLAIEGAMFLRLLPDGAKYLTEVCCHLVSHLSRPSCEEWNLTLPYFMMSGMTLTQFLKVVMEDASKCQLKPPYGKGALQVLSHVLFKEENLGQELNEEEENTIVNIFGECDGSKLSQLLMLTKLSKYDAANALAKQKQWISSCMIAAVQKTTALDHLCLMSLYLKVGNSTDAEAILAQIPQDDIIDTCVKNPSLLHSNFETLHPIANFIWDQRNEVFLQAATRWLQDGHVTLEGTLKLLESSPAHTSHSAMKIKMLEYILLESEYHPLYDNASLLLAMLYLESLKSDSAFSANEKCRQIGQRYQWLQDMEKMYGKSHSDQDETCSGKMVYKHQLESLLCSSYCTDNLVTFVLNKLRSTEDNGPSLDSVRLLCEAKQDAELTFRKILERYPQVSAQYIREMAEDPVEMLEYSLKNVAETIKKLTENKSSNEMEICTEVFKDLLDYSADLMDPQTILRILPADASAQFCLPFLRKSLHISEPETLHLKSVN